MVLALLLAFLIPFQVTTGPYAGAFRLAPDGAVNWYFATTALLRLRELPEPETRHYLDAYLAHLDPYDGIADVLPQPTGIDAPIAPDSEDAYAATFLSLAARYRTESHDLAWWRAHARTLADIAYAKLLTRVKPDGLIRASRTDPTGYLMDNAEDYAGLVAYAGVLTETDAPDAAYVRSFILPLGIAIHHLYDKQARAFKWSDNDPIGPLVPYPACTAQMYPQLDSVVTTDTRTDIEHYRAARATAARCHFSLVTSPHEALLYAFFITTLAAPTPAERQFAAYVRASATKQSDDLVTLALRDALH